MVETEETGGVPVLADEDFRLVDRPELVDEAVLRVDDTPNDHNQNQQSESKKK